MSITVTHRKGFNATRTQRDLQVSFLRRLQGMVENGEATEDRLFGFCTPDRAYVMAIQVDDDDDLQTDWLADLIVGVTSEPVTGFATGFMPVPGIPIVFTVGRTAAGVAEYTTLLFGRVQDSGVPPLMSEWLDRQARILWGEAWSPLP